MEAVAKLASELTRSELEKATFVATVSNEALCEMVHRMRLELARREGLAADGRGETRELVNSVHSLAEWLAVSQPRATLSGPVGAAIARMSAIQAELSRGRSSHADVDLFALERLMADAPAMPWVKDSGYDAIVSASGEKERGYDGQMVGESMSKATQSLILAMRDSLPRLIRELRELRHGAQAAIDEAAPDSGDVNDSDDPNGGPQADSPVVRCTVTEVAGEMDATHTHGADCDDVPF